MKIIILGLLMSFSVESLATKNCANKKMPDLQGRDYEALAIKKVLNKKNLGRYTNYNTEVYSDKIVNGRKNIASVDFFYKTKNPFRVNFYIDCKYGDYVIESDFE
jgi:hypothetical protein